MGGETVTTSYGAVLRASADWKTLDDVPSDTITQQFHEHGFLLFRGFPTGPRELDTLARRFSHELMPGVGRSTFPEYKLIHRVNESLDALEAHTDNGTRPESFRPVVTWMWCERPAAENGETTMFDGVKIWGRLSAGTRERLQALRLMFRTRYAEAAWRAMRFPDLAAFRTFVESIGGTMSPPDADGSVLIDVVSSAYCRTKYGERDAFVSSINLAGARGFEHMTVCFEDGTEIPAAMLAEIKAAIAEACEPVHWEPGDVATIDNSRFLHGRRAYRDTRRSLYLLQTLRASF